MTPRNRNRLLLVLVVVMFFASFGIAYVMRMGGWEPSQTRNFGELLSPPGDLRELTLVRADGQPHPWRPLDRNWRVLVVAPEGCGEYCTTLTDHLQRVWHGLGRKAAHLEVLWVGELPQDATVFRALTPMQPSDALLAALPDAAAPGNVPVWLVDPSGFLVMHYPHGADPSGIRRDLSRLLK